MNTIVACFALLCCFGMGVVAGKLWQAGKSTPGQRQEALARYVEPVQPERQTEPLPVWFDIEALDLLGK